MKQKIFFALTVILTVSLFIPSTSYAGTPASKLTVPVTSPSTPENSSSDEGSDDSTITLSMPSGDSGYITMKADNILGDAKEMAHENEIDLLAYQIGASRAVSGTKVNFTDLKVLKKIDRSSTVLFAKFASGQHIKSVILYVGQPNKPLCTIKLEDSVITSYKQNTDISGNALEEITFNFSKITYEYKAGQNATSGSYDLRKSSK